jgi:hypothetical protein
MMGGYTGDEMVVQTAEAIKGERRPMRSKRENTKPECTWKSATRARSNIHVLPTGVFSFQKRVALTLIPRWIGL